MLEDCDERGTVLIVQGGLYVGSAIRINTSGHVVLDRGGLYRESRI